LPKAKRKSKEGKHTFWFDLDFTYSTISKLEKARGGRTQMQYIEEATLEKLEKEEIW